MPHKKKIVWFCGLPEQARVEVFLDLGLPAGHAWSWISAHLPPPPEIELHLVCPDRHVRENITREWRGAVCHLIKVPLGGSYLMYRGWFPAFKKQARELNPDIIHGWGTEGGYGAAAISVAPKKHVLSIQGILAAMRPYLKMDVCTILNLINERQVLRSARFCVAEGEYSRRTASRYTSASIEIVSHPLRKEFIEMAPGARNEKIILYLGILARKKGFYDAIGAFLASGSDWTLNCIGTAASPKDLEQAESYLKQHDIKGQVRLVGYQTPEQIIGWFLRSPLFLLPTFIDTGPTALKEALAMGLWPVCYDNSGPKELIERYKVGTRVPTGNVEALSAALRKAVSDRSWDNNPAMEACVSDIRGHLSPAAAWRKLDGVYDRVMGQSNGLS